MSVISQYSWEKIQEESLKLSGTFSVALSSLVLWAANFNCFGLPRLLTLSHQLKEFFGVHLVLLPQSVAKYSSNKLGQYQDSPCLCQLSQGSLFCAALKLLFHIFCPIFSCSQREGKCGPVTPSFFFNTDFYILVISQ